MSFWLSAFKYHPFDTNDVRPHLFSYHFFSLLSGLFLLPAYSFFFRYADRINIHFSLSRAASRRGKSARVPVWGGFGAGRGGITSTCGTCAGKPPTCTRFFRVSAGRRHWSPKAARRAVGGGRGYSFPFVSKERIACKCFTTI